MKVGDTVKYLGEGEWQNLQAKIESVEINAVGQKTLIVRSVQPQWALSSYGAPVDRRLVWACEQCELIHESG